MTALYAYPFFEKNQVLTFGQLNSLREYLDSQIRRSRTCLTGIGVVCGLEAYPSGDGNEVVITKGVGVTSMGYLICLQEDCHLPYYRPLVPGRVWELLPDAQSAEEPLPNLGGLGDFEEPSGAKIPFLQESFGQVNKALYQNKVLVLYLEKKQQAADSCALDDCDATGGSMLFHLRKLLVGLADAKQLLAGNGLAGYMHNRQIFSDLSPIRLRRFGATGDGKGIDLEQVTTLPNFVSIYRLAIGSFFKNELGPNLLLAYQTLEPLLKDQNSLVDINGLVSGLQSRVDAIQDGHIQDAYGLARHLKKAFDEFAAEAFDLMMACCPDESEFPCHLLLGLIPEAERCQLSSVRHHFRQPPIYNGHPERIRKVRHLFERMLKMIQQFFPPTTQEIRLTPSREFSAPLGEQAIPYYFLVNGPGIRFQEYWDFEKYRRCRAHLNLSYYGKELSTELSVKYPLEYNLDPYPFYRIEGQVGLPLETVMNKLKEWRSYNNLSFDIIPLSLQEGVQTVEDVCFKNFQLSYQKLRTDLFALLNKFQRNTLSHQQTLNLIEYQGGYTTHPGSISLEDAAGGGKAVASPTPEAAQPGGLPVITKEEPTPGRKILEDAPPDTTRTTPRGLQATGGEAAGSEQKIMATFPVTANVYFPDLNRFIEFLSGNTEVKVNTAIAKVKETMPEKLEGFEIEPFKNALQFFFAVYMDDLKSTIPPAGTTAPTVINARIDSLKKKCQLIGDFREDVIPIYIQLHSLAFAPELESFVFKDYVKNHPGLEHTGGVPAGGTFFPLTDVNDKGEKTVVGDFSLPYQCCDHCKDSGGAVPDPELFALGKCVIITINPQDPNSYQTEFEVLPDSFSGDYTVRNLPPRKALGMLRRVEANAAQTGFQYQLLASPEEPFNYEIFGYEARNNKGVAVSQAEVYVWVLKPAITRVVTEGGGVVSGGGAGATTGNTGSTGSSGKSS